MKTQKKLMQWWKAADKHVCTAACRLYVKQTVCKTKKLADYIQQTACNWLHAKYYQADVKKKI